LSDPGPPDPGTPSGLTEPATTEPATRGPGEPPAEPPPPTRLGARIFTLEGRAAPGLFLVGWLATIMGVAVLFVAVQPAIANGPAVALSFLGLGLLSIGLVSGAGSQALERRRRGLAYPGPSPFLVFAAVIPSASLVNGLVFLVARPLGVSADGPLASLIALAVQAVIYIALVRLLVVGPGALTWPDMGILRRPIAIVAEDVGWGVAVGFGVLIVTVVVAALISAFLPAPDSPLPPSGTSTGLVLNLITAAILAPIGEETFFRGFATTAWARSIGVVPAIVRAAIFFDVAHVLTVGGTSFGDAALRALAAFLARLPVALALGWVFVNRRSLVASIAVHATFNGVIVLIAEAALRGGA
jgi:membrane protease YdiL (CAAX protease family)